MISVHNAKIEDFYQIRRDIVDFWGSDRILYLHHPMLIYEFGTTAFVIKEEEKVLAYLFGFLSQTEKLGYVHLVAVRKDFRNLGFAEKLYNHFAKFLKSKNISKIKAITTAHNKVSIAFHTQKVGMEMIGKPNSEGIPVVENYSDTGEDRVVFVKNI